jgi:hypothetical protein
MSITYKESKNVPDFVLINRLNELAKAVTNGSESSEFCMSIPAQLDHDADIVLSEAAIRLEQNSMIKAFANEIIDVCFDAGSLDAFDIQELAEKYGLLKLELRYADCSNDTTSCPCAEVSTEEDFKKGVECYRKAGFLR